MNDVIDTQAERDFYFSVLKENISYDEFCGQNKFERKKIDELLGIMLDVICSKKPTIRVNGEGMPRDVVKSVFLKINEDHIDYVLTALKKNTSNIRNIRAYLITALYNSANTIDNYYQAAVNYDQNQSFADQVLKNVLANYGFGGIENESSDSV